MAANPLTVYPDLTVIMSPSLAPTAAYYAVMAAFGHAIIDDTLRYDKRRKSTHRYTIAEADRYVTLTVPVSRPDHSSTSTWADVTVSDHGHWPQVHLDTLATNYGRTPFLEYYIDDLRPLLAAKQQSVTQLCADMDSWLRNMLGVPTDVTHHSDSIPLPSGAGMMDLRNVDFESADALSSLHILFNYGPESPLHLKHIQSESLLSAGVDKDVEK